MMRELQQTTKDKRGPVGDVSRYEAAAPTTAADYVTRFISKLGFKKESVVEQLARALCNKSADHTELSSRSPTSIAGACIYMARHLVGEPRTVQEMLCVGDCSKNTLSKIYRIMFLIKDRLIESKWLKAEGGVADVARLPQLRN